MKIFKPILFFFCLVFFSCSGNKENNNSDEKKPDITSGGFAVMTFEETEFNFGTIKDGAIVTHNFKFKNTGSVDLHIVSVQATCGCATPEYPTEPVAPGKEEIIKVTFDSKGRLGMNDKKVQIIYNGKPKVVFLKIKVNVQ